MDSQKTIFKSAFGHSLRSSAPIPVPEHLAHFSCALLQGRYTFKVGKNEQNGRLCLELALPEYDRDGFVEGELELEPGVEVDEEGLKMLAQLRATTTPCGMVCQNSRGALKTMFDDLAAVDLSAVKESVDKVKKGSTSIVRAALERLQSKSELVDGRTIIEMDALIAEAEKEILAELVLVSEDATVKSYLEKATLLHSQLELDDTIDSDPAMGGCCGSGGCCGDEGGCCDMDECDDDDGCCDDDACDHDHDHNHGQHDHHEGCCHDHGH